MSTMMQYDDYQTKSTLETFGFIPELTSDEIYDQIVYIINQGWTPALEHEEPALASDIYWGMWKLPFFGMRDPNEVLAEIDQCRSTYPNHIIRIVGYDNYTQCQGHNFVVYRPRGM
ncbi:MAG: ribulose bisphosphate carboxylase small subunit [Pseudomonadota bacterium]|nr:ribulose bisphosphate carboxylase small subunit [Pseudomonadota bacterium]